MLFIKVRVNYVEYRPNWLLSASNKVDRIYKNLTDMSLGHWHG